MADLIGRFARSVELIKASGRVLREEPGLLVLPAISGIATLGLAGLMIWQAESLGVLPPFGSGPLDPQDLGVGFYGFIFALYFVCYFVVIFFNTALVAAAIVRLHGDDPTVGSALALAWKRLPQILGYALVSATVGLALRFIAERLGLLGRIIEFGVGLAWTVATFLVVPVLAAEGIGPLKAVGRSAELLNDTWGENLIGNGGISIVTSLLGAIIAVIGIGGGVMMITNGNMTNGIAVCAISGVAILAIGIVSATLTGIFSGALYYFALTGNAPDGFDKALIKGSFTRKREAM